MTNKNVSKMFTIVIPVFLLILFILKEAIFGLVFQLPTCPVYSLFHLYCPACGNTRSVYALLHGDLAESMRYNIIPMVLLLLSLFGYAELATYSFGKRIYLLPRNLSFYLLLILILVIYVIVRNFVPYLTP
jgi:hypothetical protein